MQILREPRHQRPQPDPAGSRPGGRVPGLRRAARDRLLRRPRCPHPGRGFSRRHGLRGRGSDRMGGGRAAGRARRRARGHPAHRPRARARTAWPSSLDLPRTSSRRSPCAPSRRGCRPARPTRRPCCCTRPTASRSPRTSCTAYAAELGKAQGVGQVSPGTPERRQDHRVVQRRAEGGPDLRPGPRRRQGSDPRRRARRRPGGHRGPRRRHHVGLRGLPEGDEPRLSRRLPGRRGRHHDHPGAAAAQPGRADRT